MKESQSKNVEFYLKPLNIDYDLINSLMVKHSGRELNKSDYLLIAISYVLNEGIIIPEIFTNQDEFSLLLDILSNHQVLNALKKPLP